jgi:hypothetical protein
MAVCACPDDHQNRTYDIPFNELESFDTYKIPIQKNFSMWHVGMHLLTSAVNVYQNGARYSLSGLQLNNYR